MSDSTRRTFLKGGAAAGAALGLTSIGPASAGATTRKVTASFDILGLPGTVTLDTVSDLPDSTAIEVGVSPMGGNRALASIKCDLPENTVISRLSITVSVPFEDVQRIWYTQQIGGLGHYAYVGLPWSVEIPAAGNCGSMVSAAQNRYGRNRAFIGLKNQYVDGSLGFQALYGKQYLVLSINIFMKDGTFTLSGIDEALYVDREDLDTHAVVRRFVEWYDGEHNTRFVTPNAVFEPVWNTWYPSLGTLSDEFIERNARICRDVGFRTFIIDAGWFKAKGDWEPDAAIFPDFRRTIEGIQKLGLRAILWYFAFSLDKSAKANAVMDKYRLVTNGTPSHEILCVRNPEVRRFVAKNAGRLMREYGLDGLKIDFLDTEVGAPLVNCEGDHEHDVNFVSEGVREAERMMAEEIRAVKHDATIEYRLNYANIASRPYANCWRGQDTPNDPDLGRRHLALIRSWCRGVAPHSDPLFWWKDETDENVARYLAIGCLYAVPTISVDFDVIRPLHVEMMRAWLSFYHDHKARLRTGLFEPVSNDFLYSTARISTDGHTFLPVFLGEWPATLDVRREHAGVIFLFNGTGDTRVTTRLNGVSGTYEITTTDRLLRPAGRADMVKSDGGVLALDHPVEIGGMLRLRRI